MCGSMVDIQSATAENRRGEDIEDRKKEDRRNHRTKIQRPTLFYRAAVISDFKKMSVLLA